MKTWKIPEPPDAEVRVLVDASGREFHRIEGLDDYWISEELGMGRGTYHWVELLHQRGEVEAR